MRETVLVSECCVGVRCRYRHNGYARKIIDKIGQEYDILAVCPEVAGGLPVPREGCEVRDDHVVGRRTGRDYTAWQVLYLLFVSIHAPARGATLSYRQYK